MLDDDFSNAQAKVLAKYGLIAEERWIAAPTVKGQAHVLVTGEGPPVVLLNGIGVPAAMLAPLMARIEGFTQYAIDLPAYGLSDTTNEFADDLRRNAVHFLCEVFDGLGLIEPVVVANSLGSLSASWLAIDEPNRVAALAHIGCPAIALDTSAPLPMRLLSIRPLGRLMMRLQPPSERQVEQLSKMVHEHPLPPEIAQLILATERLDHFEDTFLATLNRLVHLRGNRPEHALTADQLAGIDLPTLLVFAADDPMGGPPVGERVAAATPDAELHIVDGGHAPWVHHADQIAPLVETFLHRTERR
ncbi:MAG: alpha/beta fold hydrolase [Microthrixaceae bacterium]